MVLMPHWPKSVGYSKIENHFDTVKKALEYLGNPQDKLENVIHIAGTNGKGSTLNFVKDIMLKNNLTVNCYTSPHLDHFNERIFLQKNYISDSDLMRYFNEIREKIDNKFNLTFFETTTICCLYIFSLVKSQFNLIETGLGGRIDATNIFKHKLISILTPISFDHQEFLGDNLIAITCEKSDILKNSQYNVISKQKPIVNAALKIILKDFKAKSAYFKENYDFDVEKDIYYFIDIDHKKINQFNLPTLQGCHQYINLATALKAIDLINNEKKIFKNELINSAIKTSLWKGRIEEIFLPSNLVNDKQVKIYFDGAHNDNGARALAYWLKQQKKNETNILIYGRTSNKDHHSFLKKLTNYIEEIFVVEVQNEPNPASIDEIKADISKKIDKNIYYNDDLYDIFYHINKYYTKKINIIICGSLFLYRDINYLKTQL